MPAIKQKWLTLRLDCVRVAIVFRKWIKSKIKESTIERFLTESRHTLKDGRKVLWEWVCEMQSEWK